VLAGEDIGIPAAPGDFRAVTEFMLAEFESIGLSSSYADTA
jgi:hypothetical protein